MVPFLSDNNNYLPLSNILIAITPSKQKAKQNQGISTQKANPNLIYAHFFNHFLLNNSSI
jgi:hypothetical protein